MLFFLLIQYCFKGTIHQITNKEGTGDLMAYPLFALLITAVICKLAKIHKGPSLIQQYQNTAAESTANGKITNLTSVAIVAVMAGFMIGSISQSVSISFDIFILSLGLDRTRNTKFLGSYRLCQRIFHNIS